MELLLTNQPGVNAVAWTQFMAPEGSIGVQYGDIDPRNWCRPSETFYNPAFGQNDFPADNPKRYIACHQPRHTIGLRHSNESTGSCDQRHDHSEVRAHVYDHVRPRSQPHSRVVLVILPKWGM